jgi:hypothetical protein
VPGRGRGWGGAEMAWTQAQLDILEAHVATGTTRVAYGDRTIQYGSVDEMIRLLDRMRSEVAAAEVAALGGGGPMRRSFVTFSRR